MLCIGTVFPELECLSAYEVVDEFSYTLEVIPLRIVDLNFTTVCQKTTMCLLASSMNPDRNVIEYANNTFNIWKSKVEVVEFEKLVSNKYQHLMMDLNPLKASFNLITQQQQMSTSIELPFNCRGKIEIRFSRFVKSLH